jgi:hypothetical protein
MTQGSDLSSYSLTNSLGSGVGHDQAQLAQPASPPPFTHSLHSVGRFRHCLGDPSM